MTQEDDDERGMKEQTEIDMSEAGREVLTVVLLSRAIQRRPFGDCSGRHCFSVVAEGLAIEQRGRQRDQGRGRSRLVQG